MFKGALASPVEDEAEIDVVVVEPAGKTKGQKPSATWTSIVEKATADVPPEKATIIVQALEALKAEFIDELVDEGMPMAAAIKEAERLIKLDLEAILNEMTMQEEAEMAAKTPAPMTGALTM